MKRRVLSVLLALTMLLGLLPMGALAAEEITTISTAEELKAFRDSVNGGNAYQDKTVTLTADIDLGGSEADPWTPIGTSRASSFLGTFDGGGHKITGLYINTTSDYQGLFGYIGGSGTVKDLGVGGTITGGSYTGGVVGENSGTVIGCYNTCTVSGYRNVGGVVGTGPVKNCYNTGAVSGDSFIGGVVGGLYNGERAEYCYHTGTVSGTGSDIHSVVGRNMGGTRDCYYTDTCGTRDTSAQSMTEAQFASGEVAWLLQGGMWPQSEQSWGQTLSGGGKDLFPLLTDDGAKQVYKVAFMEFSERYQGYEEYEAAYTNPNGTVALPATDPTSKDGASFTGWFTAETGGAKFTADTEITADVTLYAQFVEPHSHAVSVGCETTGGAQVTFKPLTVDADGKLCVDGTALTPDGNGKYTLGGGSYYLPEDITLNASIEVIDPNDAPVNLCLNGHTLDLGEDRIVIRATYNDGKGVLNLCDCGRDGKVTSAYCGGYTNAATIEANYQFSLYGGTVENTTARDTNGINKNGVGVNGGTACLYGGTVISENGNGLWVNPWQADGLTLSGDVTIRGGTDKAEVYFSSPDSTWESNAHFTLTGSLTRPEIPWRVAVEDTTPMPLADGWSTYMDETNFTDHFHSATQGLFVGQRENGDLELARCAITQQPSTENNYTVAANGAPASAPAYQWYPATVRSVKLGEALAGQTAPTPSGAPQGDYLCRVTWPDGTVINSDIVAYTPPKPGESKGEVEVKPGTPAIAVDQETLKDLAGEVQEGQSVTVKLTVEKQDAPAGKAELESIIQGRKDDVLYLDLSLVKQVNDGTPQVITDIGETVLEIAVPYDFAGKKDVTVYRKHGSDPAQALTKLAAKPAGSFADGSFFADSANGMVYIYASRFSTYAIGYTDDSGGEPEAPSGSGDVPNTYKPNLQQPEHGTLTVFPAAPSKGKTVTITVKPDEGYEVDAITVTDKNGENIEVTKNADGTYSYVQPGGRANITAAIKETTAAPAESKFTDVSDAAWYYDDVYYCAEKGLMQGRENNAFDPEVTTSRAMIATILWRLAGEPEAKTGATYPDCEANTWYAQAVAWASETGVAKGYDKGGFGPDDPITREQLAVMLWRYAKAEEMDVSVGEDTNILSYKDFEETGEWAVEGLQWAVGEGIVNGKPDGLLDPLGQAMRAEAAAMLRRFCELER